MIYLQIERLQALARMPDRQLIEGLASHFDQVGTQEFKRRLLDMVQIRCMKHDDMGLQHLDDATLIRALSANMYVGGDPKMKSRLVAIADKLKGA